jgi:2-methylcitrate dehydratase PrpD
MSRDHCAAFDTFSRFTLELCFEDIPTEVIDYAEDLLLDVIGVAAAASATDAGRIAREIAVLQISSNSPDQAARLIFDGRAASRVGAAYAGATQIDNFDGHDGYAPNKGHIAVALLPALLAYSECGRPLSGRDALVYFVQGYEIASRAGAALHATVSDYHTSGAWNTVAVAAMGARICGLDAEQLRQAVGIAEYHGPRSQMMREVDNPTMLHDGSGWGALAGVTAALIAEKGFTGAPAITIEGADVAQYWQDLGSTWLTTEQYIKPYPVCRWSHAPIDGALKLRREYGLSGDDIANVEIATFHESSRLSAEMPTDTAKAQYSLAFPVAAALQRGRVGPDEVLGSGLSDPAIERLVAATSVVEKDQYNDRFPAGRWGDVTAAMKDGRRLNSGPLNARGGPGDRLGRSEVIAKFHDFSDGVIGAARAGQIVDLVYALKTVETAFADLRELVLSGVE